MTRSGSVISKSLSLHSDLGYNRGMQHKGQKDTRTGRVGADWPMCGVEGSECTGVQVGSFGLCWAQISGDSTAIGL